MKYITLFLFLLASVAAFAQDVVTDTTYTINNAGTYIEVRRIVYDNGTYSEVGTLIGDAQAMNARTAAAIADKATTLSMAGKTVINSAKTISNLLSIDTVTTASLGISPITSIMLNTEKEFIGDRSTAADNPVYSITNNGGAPVSVTFPLQAASNRIRFQANGGTARNFVALGDMIVVFGYPNTGRNVLYRVAPKRFRSIDGTVVLTRQ